MLIQSGINGVNTNPCFSGAQNKIMTLNNKRLDISDKCIKNKAKITKMAAASKNMGQS